MYLLSKFGNCPSDAKNSMFRTFCTSFYGSPLWSLVGKNIECFYVAWRKCIRKIWNVSNMIHCNLLKYLYGGQAIEVQLLQRFASFYCAIMQYFSTIANNVAFAIIELCAIRDNLYFQNILNDIEIRLLIKELRIN